MKFSPHRRYTRSLSPAALAALAAAAALPSPFASADIFRWDTNTVIPGTTGITPGPAIDLSGWNTTGHLLQYANLPIDLTGATFANSDITAATFKNGTLLNVNFGGATVLRDNFSNTTAAGFSSSQLYSTSSYAAKSLFGMDLSQNNLSNWNFSSQSLASVSFIGSDLTNADFTNASLNYTIFSNTNLTPTQLATTASYVGKNLTGCKFDSNNLTSWNFSGQTVSYASFTHANLTGADFTGAVILNTLFTDTTAHGFTKEQLYSTFSYANKNLTYVDLTFNDLTNWSFNLQNLSNANLSNSTFTNTIFTNSNIINLNLTNTTAGGFTKTQLYSTASYATSHSLSGVILSFDDVNAWDFHNLNLTFASFNNSNCTNANFTGSTFTNATFARADLRGATGFIPANFTTSSFTNNTILPSGTLNNLNLLNNQRLTIFFNTSDVPVTINSSAAIATKGTLTILGGTTGSITSPDIINSGVIEFTGSGLDELHGRITGTGAVTEGQFVAVTSDGIIANSLTVNGNHIFRFNSGATINNGGSRVGNLAISMNATDSSYIGKIDLANNLLAITSTGPLDKAAKYLTINSMIASGKDTGPSGPGSWTGTGITSSVLAADAAIGTFSHTLIVADNAALHLTSLRGVPLDDSALLLVVATFGDATLDGRVDAFDLNILASHWQQGSGATWTTGDFTGDGKVDAFDLNVLATYWQSGAALEAQNSFQAAIANFPALAGVTVPEPASIALLALAAPLLLRRKR